MTWCCPVGVAIVTSPTNAPPADRAGAPDCRMVLAESTRIVALSALANATRATLEIAAHGNCKGQFVRRRRRKNCERDQAARRRIDARAQAAGARSVLAEDPRVGERERGRVPRSQVASQAHD